MRAPRLERVVCALDRLSISDLPCPRVPPPEPRASPCPHACPTSHVRDATVLGSMDDARGAGSLSYPYPIGLED